MDSELEDRRRLDTVRIVNRHEEFYALLMFFVERHYLRAHGKSFHVVHLVTSLLGFTRRVVFGELLWAEKTKSSTVQNRPRKDCSGNLS